MRKDMMWLGLLSIVAVFALVWKFGETWDSWVTASAIGCIPVMSLIIFRPEIAEEWFQDLGDGLRALMSNIFAKKGASDGEEKKEDEPKPPVP